MKHINVGFYSPTLSGDSNVNYKNGWLMVNPTPFYLHGYFRKNFRQYESYVKWHPSIILDATVEELADYCIQHNLDIFCVSLYIWNLQQILTVTAGLKDELNKRGNNKIKIIAGGPSCDAVNDDWEVKYPHIDQFIVGQGEKAWSNIALDAIGVQPISTNSSNIVFLKNKNDIIEKKYEYEFVRGIHYSPYLECPDMVNELKEKYKDIVHRLGWLYETQRGCPYHCTFCDWNGGQTNKTQKRKEISFVDEIDFFIENKMYNMYIGDANFGMWDADVEIMKRICKHKQDGHPIKFFTYSLNKQINKNHKEILRLMITNELYTSWVKFSAQDIHDDILKIIDRPGNWDDIKAFGLELYEEYRGQNKMDRLYLELIMGLPGQTVASWKETLFESYGNAFYARAYPLIALPNAPIGYDEDYRKLYNVQEDNILEVVDNEVIGNSVKEVLGNTKNLRYKMVVSTSTYSMADLVEMTMLSQLYRRMFWSNTFSIFYDGIVNHFDAVSKIISLITDSPEYRTIANERIHNFVEHRINATDDKNGNIFLRGDDVVAVLGLYYEEVQNIMNSEINDQHVIGVLSNHWRNFVGLSKRL